MHFCHECKSKDLYLGCPYCVNRKAAEINKFAKQYTQRLEDEIEFLKNELELINEQN